MKYLEINLTKEVKTLYIENYKTLRKKLDTNKWKDICAHGLEESTLLKCPYYLNQYTGTMPSL